MYKLVIEDDEGKTTVVPIIRDEITIGRKDGNTIRLTERNVSRRHARLIKEGDALHIEDVASRYGTRHNGEKLDSRQPFREGDVVMIGDYRLSVQIDRAAARKAQQSGAKTEATQTEMPAMEDEEEIPISQAGKLVVISSNYAGREYRLTRTEMVIGRTEGDIRIDHRSISRNHAKVVYETAENQGGENRYKIVDLRSSNGVRVNGEEYRSVHLKRGDVIELGHVRFRYVEPGEVFHFVPDRNTYSEPAPSMGAGGGNGGLGKMMAVAAVLGVFLVVAGIVGFLFVSSSDDGKKDNKPGDEKPVVADKPVVPEDASVKAYLQDADKAIAKEDWDIAVALLERAKERDPSNSSILDKLSQAQRERPLKEHYEKGKKALDQGDYQTALDEFIKLPGDTNLSIYSNRVKNQGLREQAEQGMVDNFLDEAREAQRQKKWFEVRKATDKVLDIDDKNEEALRLSRLASRELRDDNRVAAKNDERPGREEPRDKTPAKENPPKETPKANGGAGKENPPAAAGMSAEEMKTRRNELLGRAAASNRSGNFGEAISLAQEALSCCKGGKRAIYQIALAYQRQGNNAQAITWYNKWLAGNPSSRLADNVRDTIRSLGGTPIN